MKTFEDLVRIGENEQSRAEFCENAVKLFKASKDYANAQIAQKYYEKHNVTIERYQKYISTLSGQRVVDPFSANYKIKSTRFRKLVTQQVQYVLGNGVKLKDEKSKERLGKDFDFQLQRLAKLALVGGRSFGFWNFDHLEVFGYADSEKQAGFCPLYSEETAELMGGVRFYSMMIGNKVYNFYTLYEPDGYTEYRKAPDKDIEVTQEKSKYKTTRVQTKSGLVEHEYGENYDSLPIAQMFASDTYESELIGLREAIDCYDLVKSGLANDIDDLSGFFWIIENSGGMEDYDLASFIQRMKTVRASSVDSDDGGKASVQTVEIPVTARATMLELLRKDIYEDFQALDVETLSASAKTTQEIKASYQAQDNKCADFEYFCIDFVCKILELAGIDDYPVFTWNRIINEQEQTNMILSASSYLSEECVIRHLPFLTPEEIEEEIRIRQTEQLDRFSANSTKDSQDLDDSTAEDIVQNDEMTEE